LLCLEQEVVAKVHKKKRFSKLFIGELRKTLFACIISLFVGNFHYLAEIDL